MNRKSFIRKQTSFYWNHESTGIIGSQYNDRNEQRVSNKYILAGHTVEIAMQLIPSTQAMSIALNLHKEAAR